MAAKQPDPEPLRAIIERLSAEELRSIVQSAAGRHDDVDRQVRMAAARGAGDLTELRAVVDRALRTRRFLDYRESLAWRAAGQPVVEELRPMGESASSQELVELLQRAIGHVIRRGRAAQPAAPAQPTSSVNARHRRCRQR